MWKAGPNPLLLLPLTFPEVNQVPIPCWVDSESWSLLVLLGLKPVIFRTTAKSSNHLTMAPLIYRKIPKYLDT